MIKKQFYKNVFKSIIGIMAILLLCRLTLGGMAVVIALLGVVAAWMRKPTIVASCFVFFPLMAIFNHAIVGMSGISLLAARFAFVGITVSALLSGRMWGNNFERPPLGWLILYLLVSFISSMNGWMPTISYLKILNFLIMLLGVHILAVQMQSSISCLKMLRSIFMAVSIIMILGSILSYFVPSIGFSMMVYKMEIFGIYTTGEELAQGGSLFNGMTCHSQYLSAVIACLATWVLCDMVLIERSLSIPHVVVLLCVPILLYMSRSRGGLLMLVSVMAVMLFVTVPKARLPVNVKRHLRIAIMVCSCTLICVAVYYQIKNDAISRWLRKTDDVASDTRTLEEAFTDSRQYLIAMNLRDFKLNPLLGMGFQVADGMKQAYESGQITWFSASVEKGVTPYVILGEAGILGAIAFIIFLWSFYYTCFRKGYMSLMTNFTCFLVANLADSTFFSPSGLGGFMWMVACIGAFSTDCLAKQLHWMRVTGGWEQENENWTPARV